MPPPLDNLFSDEVCRSNSSVRFVFKPFLDQVVAGDLKENQTASSLDQIQMDELHANVWKGFLRRCPIRYTLHHFAGDWGIDGDSKNVRGMFGAIADGRFDAALNICFIREWMQERLRFSAYVSMEYLVIVTKQTEAFSGLKEIFVKTLDGGSWWMMILNMSLAVAAMVALKRFRRREPRRLHISCPPDTGVVRDAWDAVHRLSWAPDNEDLNSSVATQILGLFWNFFLFTFLTLFSAGVITNSVNPVGKINSLEDLSKLPDPKISWNTDFDGQLKSFNFESINKLRPFRVLTPGISWVSTQNWESFLVDGDRALLVQTSLLKDLNDSDVCRWRFVEDLNVAWGAGFVLNAEKTALMSALNRHITTEFATGRMGFTWELMKKREMIRECRSQDPGMLPVKVIGDLTVVTAGGMGVALASMAAERALKLGKRRRRRRMGGEEDMAEISDRV